MGGGSSRSRGGFEESERRRVLIEASSINAMLKLRNVKGSSDLRARVCRDFKKRVGSCCCICLLLLLLHLLAAAAAAAAAAASAAAATYLVFCRLVGMEFYQCRIRG